MNEHEIGSAVSNVITLVDIARKDVLEIDKMLKVGINGQPSILVEIDRLKLKVDLLEERLSKLPETCNNDNTVFEKEAKTNIKTNETRIIKLEKLLYITTGVVGAITFVVTYGSKIMKFFSSF